MVIKNFFSKKSFNRIEAESIVTKFYRCILERSPDKNGLVHHVSNISNLNYTDSVGNLLNAFLGSDEYKQKFYNQEIDLNKLFNYKNNKKLINGMPVAHVTSLGSFCLTSSILKGNGLKKFSLPFDWIFSSPEVVIDCLENNFSIFLNSKYYQSILKRKDGRTEKGTEHLYYKEFFGISDMFTHHDLNVKEDFEYIKRCVDRFQNLLKLDDGKLFVILDPENKNIKDVENVFLRLSNVLMSKTNNSALLYIQLDAPTNEVGCSSMLKISEMDYHKLYKYKPSSQNDGVSFLHDFDNIPIFNLIYNYQFLLKNSIV